jgi:hypothetical protein
MTISGLFRLTGFGLLNDTFKRTGYAAYNQTVDVNHELGCGNCHRLS